MYEGAIAFGFPSAWFKRWPESFKAIFERCSRNCVTTLSSHLKIVLRKQHNQQAIRDSVACNFSSRTAHRRNWDKCSKRIFAFKINTRQVSRAWSSRPRAVASKRYLGKWQDPAKSPLERSPWLNWTRLECQPLIRKLISGRIPEPEWASEIEPRTELQLWQVYSEEL